MQTVPVKKGVSIKQKRAGLLSQNNSRTKPYLAEDETLVQQVAEALWKAGLHGRYPERVFFSAAVDKGHKVHAQHGRGVGDGGHSEQRQHPLGREPEDARVKAEMAGFRACLG